MQRLRGNPEAGFTLVELVVALGIGALIGAALMAFFGGGGGGGGSAPRAERRWKSVVVTPLPSYLSSSGSPIAVDLYERTDTVVGSKVVFDGQWALVSGVPVEFRVTQNQTAAIGAAGTYSVDHSTDANGQVTDILYPGDAAGSNELVLTWTLPNGQKPVDKHPFKTQ